MARLGTSPPRRRARLRPGRVQLAGEIDIDAGDFDIGHKLELSNTQPVAFENSVMHRSTSRGCFVLVDEAAEQFVLADVPFGSVGGR
jgi:hypothetical protein